MYDEMEQRGKSVDVAAESSYNDLCRCLCFIFYLDLQSSWVVLIEVFCQLAGVLNEAPCPFREYLCRSHSTVTGIAAVVT